MRIGIDARMITHPGIGSYTRNLLANLFAQRDGETYVLLGDKALLGGYSKDKAISAREANFPVYGVKEQLLMPGATNGVDLLHVPHYNIPVFYGGRLVVTVHDLIHLLFPEYLPSGAALMYARFMYSQVAKKAHRIIAVSENTKKDIIRHLRVNEEKIVVTHEGVGAEYRRINEPAQLDGIRQKYNLDKPFILCVSTMRYHKNILNLVEAFLKLKKENGVSERLVLVGRKDRKARKIYDFILNLPADGPIRYLGEVPPKDMPYIYNLAKVFVFPSFYEGFGLPVLEAMACGAPVVASDTSSVPEVAGNAARLVDPRSVEEMTKGIYEVLSNEGLRASMVSRGFEQAKRFGWAETARRTRQVYLEASK